MSWKKPAQVHWQNRPCLHEHLIFASPGAAVLLLETAQNMWVYTGLWGEEKPSGFRYLSDRHQWGSAVSLLQLKTEKIFLAAPLSTYLSVWSYSRKKKDPIACPSPSLAVCCTGVARATCAAPKLKKQKGRALPRTQQRWKQGWRQSPLHWPAPLAPHT